MNLCTKYKEAIEYTNSEAFIKRYDDIIETLKTSELKNIAVLGETNSGKTELINKLVGKEVRTATRLSLGEPPLMVTFKSQESKNGYEVVNVDECSDDYSDIALHEIPVNLAIDYDSGACNDMLESMDAVIYVISAITPLTASDVRNLKSLIYNFPLIIYISKTDLLDNENEYNDCVQYIKEGFRGIFTDAYCEFFDGKNENFAQDIIAVFKDFSLQEVREYHILRIENSAKSYITQKLKSSLDGLSKERENRRKEFEKANIKDRESVLQKETLRVRMLEKEQEVNDYIDKSIITAKIAAKHNINSMLSNTSDKKNWLNSQLKIVLGGILNQTASKISNEVNDIVQLHISWLVSEVNRQYKKKLVFDKADSSVKYLDGDVPAFNETKNYGKSALAIGSSAVAVGVILSSVTLVPTLLVAIPASVLSLAMFVSSADDKDKYDKKVVAFVDKCVEDNFNKLAQQLHSNIRKYYEKATSDIMSLVTTSGTSISFDDIDKAESELVSLISTVTE